MSKKSKNKSGVVNPSRILIDLDPNGQSAAVIRVVADNQEHRDEALSALQSVLPSLEMLESAVQPKAVSVRIDGQQETWFAGFNGELVTAEGFFFAKALTPEVGKEVCTRLVNLGHKVSVFRNSKEDFATDVNAVWQ
jgi:hypothetical protein